MAKSDIGDNSLGKDAKAALKSYIDRIERLEEDKALVGSDIKSVYEEAKAGGFDAKVIRQIVKLRKSSREEREAAAAKLDLYLHALGMLADTPLGKAAMDAAGVEAAADQPAT